MILTAEPTTNPPAPRQHIASATSQAEARHDADLVRRFLAGEEEAFGEIITRYRQKLYHLALSLLRDHGDAEEIVQDAFIRAHRGLARFRGDSSLATWLHRITVNLARNRHWYFFRRRRHAAISLQQPLDEDSAGSFGDILAAEQADPAHDTVNNEYAALVATALERLEARHREILILRNVRHLSYEEIAGQLGLQIGTVKSRLSRAREQLRALINEACPEFTADADPSEYFLPRRAAYGAPALAYA